MTEKLINALQATPLTGRTYNVVLCHIRADYRRIKANNPDNPPRIFHTVECREGSNPKWFVSEADAIAYRAMTLPPGPAARKDKETA